MISIPEFEVYELPVAVINFPGRMSCRCQAWKFPPEKRDDANCLHGALQLLLSDDPGVLAIGFVPGGDGSSSPKEATVKIIWRSDIFHVCVSKDPLVDRIKSAGLSDEVSTRAAAELSKYPEGAGVARFEGFRLCIRC